MTIKFDAVDASLAALVFHDEGLRFPVLFRQLLLPDARRMSHCDKHRNEPGIFRSMQEPEYRPLLR